jgi:hypothetical protein
MEESKAAGLVPGLLNSVILASRPRNSPNSQTHLDYIYDEMDQVLNDRNLYK